MPNFKEISSKILNKDTFTNSDFFDADDEFDDLVDVLDDDDDDDDEEDEFDDLLDDLDDEDDIDDCWCDDDKEDDEDVESLPTKLATGTVLTASQIDAFMKEIAVNKHLAQNFENLWILYQLGKVKHNENSSN